MTPATSQPKGISLWLPVIISNIIPLIGVLFFGWSLANVIILYWVENLIIGFWNIPRIILAGKSERSKNVVTAVFFTIHYGIFCAVHGSFILGLVNYSKDAASHVSKLTDHINTGLIIGAVTMFISIGWDFYTSYIKNSDYKNWDDSKAMFSPYGHIFVIHLAILIAGFGTMYLGSPMILLAALIIGKTILELKGREKRLGFKS